MIFLHGDGMRKAIDSGEVKQLVQQMENASLSGRPARHGRDQKGSAIASL